jgi:hypothetical protein
MAIDLTRFNQGGLTQKVSLRDYRLEVIPRAIQLPSSFEIPFSGKIKNQGTSSSCVSQATSYYAEVLNFKETGQWIELSQKFLYSQCFIPPTGGSYTKDNMALMTNEGIATEQDTPSYKQNLTPPDEPFMEAKQDITAQASEDALTYITKSYYTFDNSKIDLFKQAIIQGNGCVVISWGNNVLWTTKTGVVGLPDVASQMVWQHGIFLCGFFSISDADDELVKQGLMTMDEARKRFDTGITH